MTNANRSFEKLENALVDAGHHIDYPPAPTVLPQVRLRLGKTRSRQAPRFAIALALIVILGWVKLPEIRDAFTQFTGLVSTTTPSLTTPTLSMTAQPNPNLSLTWTSTPATQTPTAQSTRVSTPLTLANSVEIRLLAKPAAHPRDLTQFK